MGPLDIQRLLAIPSSAASIFRPFSSGILDCKICRRQPELVGEHGQVCCRAGIVISIHDYDYPAAAAWHFSGSRNRTPADRARNQAVNAGQRGGRFSAGVGLGPDRSLGSANDVVRMHSLPDILRPLNARLWNDALAAPNLRGD